MNKPQKNHTHQQTNKIEKDKKIKTDITLARKEQKNIDINRQSSNQTSNKQTVT